MHSSTSVKPLPHLPTVPHDSPLPLALDDESRIQLWKLIHTWLRHGQLQAKWATVINDLLLRILQTKRSETSSLNCAETNNGYSSSPMCIHLFETGSPPQSKYLASSSDGTLLQALTELPLPAVYGGTIRLYGAPKSLQRKLVDIMAVSLYTLYSLQLEMHLMRDHRVQLSTELSSSHQAYSERKQVSPIAASETVNSSWRSGVLGWILKRYGNKAVDDNIKAASPSLVNRRHSMLGSKTLSRKPVDIRTINDSVPESNAPPAYHESPDSRFYRDLRLRLQGAILSTSPTCLFTAPSIITVLDAEEEALDTMKTIITNGQRQQREISKHKHLLGGQLLREKLTSLARRSSTNSSLFGSESPLLNGHLSTVITLPQSIMAYSLLRIPRKILNNTSKVGMDHLYLDTESIEAFTYHQHMVISYSFHPIGCPDRPCVGPTLCSTQYFRFNDLSPYSDCTLGSTLKGWLNHGHQSCKHWNTQKKLVCGDHLKSTYGSSQSLDHHQTQSDGIERQQSDILDSTLAPMSRKQQTTSSTGTTPKVPLHGCSQTLQDHVLCFSNGSSRISVYFIKTAPSDSPHSEDISKPVLNDTNNNNLLCWSTCTICDAHTPPLPMSQSSCSFSFAKYLELCLYSTRLMGPRNDLCQHAKSISSVVARCFALETIGTTMEVRFVKEDTSVYRLRGSPLQAIKPAETATSLVLSPRISSSTMERWKRKEEMAVDNLFAVIRQHLLSLHNNTTNQWLSSDDPDVLYWSTHLNTDQQQLVSALKEACSDMYGSNLNDFRRFFTMKASIIMDSLTNWQRQRWPDGNGKSPPLLTWKDRPDYMNADTNDTIHCFPGSAIMVRELEPSSIVAFTLSSNEYTEELADTCASGGDLEPLSVPPIKTMASPTLSAKSGSEDSKQSNNSNDATQVIDSYYSSVERKYIAPSTGSETETASFRTMVMETIKSNVSEMEQHTPRLSQLWRSAPVSFPDKIHLAQKVERDLALDPYQSTKDIKESAFYQDPLRTASSKVDMSPTPVETPKAISPHIKHRFIHGNKEFTCIVYYANEFELLRKSCGVDQLVIESLGRCENWEMTGGKSKSKFYKTHGTVKGQAQWQCLSKRTHLALLLVDNRLVVKEMMNAWNIAEKDAFLRFAPKYLDYMKTTDQAPTVLAKVFGFYSVEMRTLNDKKQIFNMDVLVMEQLFYGQSISKTFDLKGIPDRLIEKEKRNQADTTLWDGDWKEAYRMGYFTFEQSHAWVESAIRRDTEFLASSNIMDYSLLVGIDEAKKELSVGIVDFIGAYTWYKKIESRSKSTLQRNREVTVLPPHQYRLRFCREVPDYFIPIPGKFDKIPLRETNSSSWMT